MDAAMHFSLESLGDIDFSRLNIGEDYMIPRDNSFLYALDCCVRRITQPKVDGSNEPTSVN